MRARKRAYLQALAARDPDQGPALSRGYLRVPGNRVNVNGEEKRPTATRAEIKAANKAAEESQALWYDTPALRVDVADPFEIEHVNDVMARMAATDQREVAPNAVEFPPWFVKDIDLPKADDFCHARRVLGFSYRVGARVYVENDKGELKPVLIQDWIKKVLGDPEDFLTDGLVDRIRASFDLPSPDAHTPSPSQSLVDRLAKLTPEDQDEPLGTGKASALLNQIAYFLHAPAQKGADGNITAPGDPTLYTDFEAELSKYVNKLSEEFRPEEIWPEETWKAVELLTWLGDLSRKYFMISIRELAERAPKAPGIELSRAQLDGCRVSITACLCSSRIPP